MGQSKGLRIIQYFYLTIFHTQGANRSAKSTGKFIGTIIQYFMIVVVFAFLPIVVNQKGLMSVDILTRKFPGWLLKGINIFSYVVGTVLFSFLAYNGIALLNKHIVQKTASANQTGAFLIWPFTLFFVIGLILLSITCIWKTIKLCATPSAGFVKTDSGKDKEKEEEK